MFLSISSAIHLQFICKDNLTSVQKSSTPNLLILKYRQKFLPCDRDCSLSVEALSWFTQSPAVEWFSRMSVRNCPEHSVCEGKIIPTHRPKDTLSNHPWNIYRESVSVRKLLRWVLLASERAPASPTSTASPLARASPFTATLQNPRCRESITFPVRKFFRSYV